MQDYKKFLLQKQELLAENIVKDGFIRKKLGINISKAELDEFFKSIEGKTYKTINTHFKTDFNNYFNVSIDGFSTPEATFLKNTYSTQQGRSFTITAEEKVQDTAGTATKVSQLSKGKAKKLKVPSGKGDKLEKFVETVILNMLGNAKGKLLLTGDPGTGKTSTIKTVISLLKLNLITIEAPHVSEENIISVPYLIKKGNTETVETMEIDGNSAEFEVINAESNLISQLKRAKPIKDNQYNAWLKSNKLLAPLAAKYKKVIDERIPYTNVLFIDELYRVGNQRVQNLFRTILGGKIGTTSIPANTYIIYASNMDDSDGSLDEISLNQQFKEIEFDKPSKNDFMRYMADKFSNTDVNTGEETTDAPSTNIDSSVYNTFMDALTDSELGGKDTNTEAEIRISPRRWEEIIKYINANIPPKDLQQARMLLTFLKDNMSDYTTGETSALYSKYSELVKKLISENSDIADEIEPIPNNQWRDNLEGQISTKLKMGEDRKYIPVISGKPGIGKSTMVDDIVKKYKLKKIMFEAQTLEAESVIGLTAPRTNADGSVTTEFTTPPLYKQIMADYTPNLEPEPGSKYTHLLLIDELTRASTKVFNGIRSLMLDKKVGSKKIPNDIMIVGAMNPFDLGTNTLTDHMKDVVDIVNAEGDITDTLSFFKTTEVYKDGNKQLGFPLSDAVMDFFNNTLNTFRSDLDTDGESTSINSSSFYWTDNLNVAYISPREFDDMINGTIQDALNMLELRNDFSSGPSFNADDVPAYISTIQDAIRSSFHTVFKFVISKQKLTDTDFMDKFDAYIETALLNSYDSLESVINTAKSEATTSLIDLFKNSTIQELLDYPDIKDVLENIIENSDVNDIITDADDIFTETNHKSDAVEVFDNVVDLYKLFSVVDWSKYSAEITANISTSIVERGLKPIVQRALDDNGEINGEPANSYIQKHVKDYNTLVELIQKAKTNKNNMFV